VQDHLHAETLAAPSDWKFNSYLWKATAPFKVEELRLHGKQLEHLHPHPYLGLHQCIRLSKETIKVKLILPETKENQQSYIHMDWLLPQAAQETRSFDQDNIAFLKSHRYIVQTSVRQFLSFMKNSQFWFVKEI